MIPTNIEQRNQMFGTEVVDVGAFKKKWFPPGIVQ